MKKDAARRVSVEVLIWFYWFTGILMIFFWMA
jgi:hypothetical protein